MENERGTVHDNDCEGCIHHWLINERNFGVCKKCGASKQFCGSWDAANQNAWYPRSNKGQHGVPGTKK